MDEPPRITNTQVREWNEAIKDWRDQTTPLDGYSPQHPAFLWKFCWEHLNTMRIPIFPAELFFEKAIEIAKDESVTTGKGFMRRFAHEIPKIENRWSIGFDIVHHLLQKRVFHHGQDTPYSPNQDAWKSVRNAYGDRSFYSFLDLLRGITAGWKPDSAIESEENYVPGSYDPSEHDLYNGCYGYDYVLDEIITQPEVMEIPPNDYAILRKGSPSRANIKLYDYDWLCALLSDGNTFHYDQHAGEHHCGSKNCNYGIPPDGVLTQPGEPSQKREKKVRFDGIPDDDNKQRSERQKLDRSTAEPLQFEYVPEETAAGTSDNQMSESHTADPPLSHAMSSFTQPIKEERPAKRSKRQRQEPPTADSPSSFTAFSSSGNTEERPAKRVRRQLPENDTAGSSLPHASSSHTERVEGKRPAKRTKRQLPENDTTESSLRHASSSHTERVEGERPAKRIKREMPEDDTAGSLLPHASSSRTERVEEEISAGRLEPQGREFATADSPLSPIPSPTRSARGAAKRLRRQKREPATADSPLSAVPSPTGSARGAAKRLRRRVSQGRTTDSPNTRTSRSNRGAALWQLDRDGEPVEV